MTVSQISNGEIGSSVRTKLNSVVAIANAISLGVTQAEMAALDTSIQTIAFLNENKRQGLFKWNASDLSTQVTADTLQGVYVAPSSDATGASGAWVRMLDGYVTPEMFGAYGDLIELGNSAHDDRAAIQAAIDFCGPTNGILEIDLPRHYRLASFNPNLSNRCCLSMAVQGVTMKGRYVGGPNQYDPFTFKYVDVSAGQTADSILEINASGIIIRDLRIIGAVTGTSAIVFETGIRFSYTGYQNRHIIHNIHVSMGGIGNYDIAGKTWGTTISDCCLDGAVLDGMHINISTSLTVANVYVSGCGRYGFYMQGWYGNLIGCSADNCGDYAYYVANRSWTLTQCGTEQCAKALYSFAIVTVSGFYYELSPAGAAANYPIVAEGGSLTISGLYKQNTHNGKIVNVTGAAFSCLDETILQSQVDVSAGTAVFPGGVKNEYTRNWVVVNNYPFTELTGGVEGESAGQSQLTNIFWIGRRQLL